MDGTITEYSKSHLRMSCVIEAGKLKQNSMTSDEYKEKSVVDIAKEISEFVLGEET